MPLSAKQVAELLGISPRKVYELGASGALPCYRFGAAVRFEAADIEAYRASCRSSRPSNAGASTVNLTKTLNTSESELADYFRKAGIKPRPAPQRT